MGFMNEISEKQGEQFAYCVILNKLQFLEKKYEKQYGAKIPEMYADVYFDILNYVQSKMNRGDNE